MRLLPSGVLRLFRESAPLCAAFEFKRRLKLKVAPNSFICFGRRRNSYSIPHRLIGHHVEVTYTATLVRAYHQGECVATHQRSYGHNDYTFIEGHMAPHSQAVRAFSARYFIEKASKISPEFETVIRGLFAGLRHEQLGFNTAQGFFKLQRECEPTLFHRACTIAVNLGNLKFKFLSGLVKTRCEGFEEDPDMLTPPVMHENIRGKAAFN